ncbi:unnamed protein product [Medioppia subpectinata]|uniref:Cytochrome P450 n=1 Tax=Medioppia subpectinata TaxID=1979941 RepID=A0A7R9LFK2_9ACAR|nr:unnamed protein product [Medioppia subpectinata]CAG2118402.1 unnamed protein product [Medioppia subpectinata]
MQFKSGPVWHQVFRGLTAQYGPVFTFWFGGVPRIIIADTDMAREAYRKNDFAGRPWSYLGSQLSNDDFKDVLFTDYGHTWEALRRVAHSAVIPIESV